MAHGGLKHVKGELAGTSKHHLPEITCIIRKQKMMAAICKNNTLGEMDAKLNKIGRHDSLLHKMGSKYNDHHDKYIKTHTKWNG
jgi:hypothetical protein